MKGFFFTTTSAIVISILVIALLVAEGLIIGLLARPECEAYSPTKITTTKATLPTTSSTTTVSATSTTTTATQPTLETEPWRSYRMPLNLIPYEYDLSFRPILEPDQNGEYIFKGSSTVRYTCKLPTEYIILHSRLLEYQLDDWKLTKIDGSEIILTRMFFYDDNNYVVLQTENSCTEEEKYELTLSDFKGYLRLDNIGFYRSGYVNSNGEYIVIATTQMESVGARKAFPCFDEPAFKAKFTIQLWHKTNSNYFSLSNMPAERYQNETIEGEQWTRTTFQQSAVMQTYSVAMVVSDFTFYNENVTSVGVQIRVYARPEYIKSGDGEYTAAITPPALEFFEEYIGVPYPLPKSDQISVPDFFAGAQENWGLVIYRETAMLYNDTTTSDTNKIYITNVITHELAHQWFGNLVTCEWWDQTWLNEGFATYYAYIGEEAVQPTWKPTKRFILDEMRPAFKADELTTSRPIVQEVNADANIQQMFDTISYNKGGSVVRMVQNFMGEEYFGGAIREYMEARKFDVANQHQLIYHLEQHTSHLSLPTEFSTILETWTLQMGFPLVTVFDVDPLTNIFRITQEYYLRDADATPVPTAGSLKYGYKWYIPFTFKRGSNLAKEAELVWLTPDEPVYLTETDFILGNSEVKGFFRVNYDLDSRERIANRLDSVFFQDIPEENRAQLLDDAFALASSGRLDPIIPLDMSNYLHRDTSYMAWGTFWDNMKYYEYMFGRTDVFGTFKNYVLELIVPSLYNVYGWEDGPRTDDKLLERQTRAVGIGAACYYEYPDCVQTSVNYFKEWMASPDDLGIMPVSYRDDILCTAIRAGGIEEWNFAWGKYFVSPPSWQSSLRYGLACSKDPWILNRYLEYTLDPTLIRGQDASSVLQYVGGEEYGKDVAWAFLLNKYDELLASFGTRTLSAFVSSIVRRFSTEYDLKLLEDFKENNANSGTLFATVDSAIETTISNIKWRADNEEPLTQWLYSNVKNVV